MDRITQQYLISAAALAVGASAWIVPDQYNPLKLKARYAKYVSEQTNIKIARALGAMFIVIGLMAGVATLMIGEIK